MGVVDLSNASYISSRKGDISSPALKSTFLFKVMLYKLPSQVLIWVVIELAKNIWLLFLLPMPLVLELEAPAS